MRQFYQAFPVQQICQTLSDKLLLAGKIQTASGKSPAQRREKSQTVSDRLSLDDLVACFPLPWSAYVRLLSVKNEQARKFYEAEALRGGWSVRQLDRQIHSLFYDRTALSRSKAKMLAKADARHEDAITPEEEIKDPYVLEFLGLKDEYSESEIEEALILHLERFLLELGGDFAFIGRQRRLRIGDEWYRIDLLFFHRKLRCLLVIDLKRGRFTHADAGQMHMYLNYARIGRRKAKIRRSVSFFAARKMKRSRVTRLMDCRTKFSRLNTARSCPMNNSSPMRLRKRASNWRGADRSPADVIRITFVQLAREAVCFLGVTRLAKCDRGFVQRARSDGWIVIKQGDSLKSFASVIEVPAL